MSQFYLKLLGPPSVESELGDVTPGRQKSLAILTYLTTTGRKISRSDLASLFWPDSDTSKALGALRTALANINSSLNPRIFSDRKEYIKVDRKEIDCDVILFRKILKNHSSLEEMKDAAALWKGGFLKGFELKGTPLYSDWQYLEEQNLEQEYRRLLTIISTLLIEKGEEEEALQYKRKLLIIDPYDEENHREIMKLHAHMGDKTSALQQYKICRKYLEDDLGFPVEEATSRLAEEIRNDRTLKRSSNRYPHTNQMEKRLPRLAVLPFLFEECVSRDQPDFSHIVSEAITNQCLKHKELEVISRTSTLSYRGSSKNLPRIAAELKADYMIEGDLEDRIEHIWLDARLINASQDTVICSERIECLPSGDSLTDGVWEITATLLENLEIYTGERKKSSEDPGLPWRLNGYSLLKEYDPDLQKRALKSFNRALELNSNDVSAWAGIGLTKLSLCHFGIFGADTKKLYREAEEAANKSLAINPEEPTGLFIKGWVTEDYYWDFTKAEALYDRAIKHQPDNANFLIGRFSIQLRKKKVEEAVDTLEKINRLAPFCGLSLTSRFWGLMAIRQYRKAHMLVEEVCPFLQSESVNGFFKALIQLILKRHDQAIGIMEEIHDLLIRENKGTLLFALAYAYGADGQKEKAEKIIGQMKMGRDNLTGYNIPIAAVHTVLGEYDKAMELIDQAIEHRDSGIFFLIYLPFYDPLFSFPRFRDQMKRAGFEAWI